MKKIILGLAVLMFFTVLGCGDRSQEVATVNGKKITANDLQMEIENLPPDYKMFAQSPEMKKRILDNLIVAELLVQAAEKDGVLAKPEIQGKLKETEMGIRAEAESKLESLKMQKEKAADIAKREVVIKNFREKQDFKGVEVAEKEIMDSYTNYSKMMKQRDPKAKVEAYSAIKEDIKKSLAMQKTVEAMKKAADIKINESAFPAEPPVSFNPQGGGVKIQEPADSKKTEVKVK